MGAGILNVSTGNTAREAAGIAFGTVSRGGTHRITARHAVHVGMLDRGNHYVERGEHVGQIDGRAQNAQAFAHRCGGADVQAARIAAGITQAVDGPWRSCVVIGVDRGSLKIGGVFDRRMGDLVHVAIGNLGARGVAREAARSAGVRIERVDAVRAHGESVERIHACVRHRGNIGVNQAEQIGQINLKTLDAAQDAQATASVGRCSKRTRGEQARETACIAAALDALQVVDSPLVGIRIVFRHAFHHAAAEHARKATSFVGHDGGIAVDCVGHIAVAIFRNKVRDGAEQAGNGAERKDGCVVCHVGKAARLGIAHEAAGRAVVGIGRHAVKAHHVAVR